ncbi:MAG: hypothetical protein WC969_00360 [Elusimicrobiota bacterium]|jgi:hypothetical protein
MNRIALAVLAVSFCVPAHAGSLRFGTGMESLLAGEPDALQTVNFDARKTVKTKKPAAVTAPAAPAVPDVPKPVPAAEPEFIMPAEDAAALVAAWKKNFAELPATKEHSEFLEAGKVPILIVSPKEHQLGKSPAAFIDGTVYVNQLALGKLFAELYAQGVTKKDELFAVVSWRLLPFISHEVRHGMTSAALAEAVGRPLHAALAEGETLSFADQAVVKAAAVKAHPEMWKPVLKKPDALEALVAKAAADGVPGLESMVGMYYGLPFILQSERKDLETRYREQLPGLERKLMGIRKYKELIADPATKPEVVAELQMRLSMAPTEEDAASHVQKCTEAVEFFSDNGLYKKARKFFEKRYDELADQLEAGAAK